MFCDGCGTQLRESQSFCPTCGKAAGTVPLMPARSRIAGHLRLLGIFWIAISALRVFIGLILWSVSRYGLQFIPPDVPAFAHAILRVVGGSLIATGVLGLVTGWGLLERQPWARVLAIVLAIIFLIDMPFGTALGVYTLWVLLPSKSEEEYRQISEAEQTT